jgi:hydrogenase expression/formation protein HypC
MCLAVPAKIIELNQSRAKVEVGGITREASTALLPDAAVGDYVLVHAGFAITQVDEQEALGTLELFDEMAAAQVQEDPPTGSDERPAGGSAGGDGSDSTGFHDDSAPVRD